MVNARIDRAGDTDARVVVEGELDLAALPELTDALNKAVAEYRDTVVDLSHVTFIDSSGIGALVRGLREASANGHGYRVCGVNNLVLSVMKVAGVYLPLTNGVQPRGHG